MANISRGDFILTLSLRAQLHNFLVVLINQVHK